MTCLQEDLFTSLPEPFSIRSKRTGHVHRLTPLGELDIATVPQLREAFEQAFCDSDAEMLVVDLTELSFMDSTGTKLLLDLNEVCKLVDRLRIVNGSPPVVRIIDLACVRPVLPIISSRDDPLAPLDSN